MAHMKTTAIQVNSDTANGAYLNFYETSLPGVGVWHLTHKHPQYVHVRSGIVSYLVFDNWDVALDWLADAVNMGDRVYEVRDSELVDVSERVLDAEPAITVDAVPTVQP